MTGRICHVVSSPRRALQRLDQVRRNRFEADRPTLGLEPPDELAQQRDPRVVDLVQPVAADGDVAVRGVAKEHHPTSDEPRRLARQNTSQADGAAVDLCSPEADPAQLALRTVWIWIHLW